MRTVKRWAFLGLPLLLWLGVWLAQSNFREGRILKVTTVRVIGGNGFFYHYEMPQFDSYYWINEMHQVKGIDSAE